MRLVAWAVRSRGRLGHRWVVWVGLQRRDSCFHPHIERQSAEQSVELGFAFGTVETNDLHLPEGDRRLPEPDKMPFDRQFGRGGDLGVLAVLDLRIRSSFRNTELELD